MVPGAVGCFHSSGARCVVGARSIPRHDQNLTDRMVDTRELNYGTLPQAVQIEVFQVQSCLGKQDFRQNALLKKPFSSNAGLYRKRLPPFPIATYIITHSCYLIEESGHTSHRQHTTNCL